MGQGQASADPADLVDRAITGGPYYRYEWAQEKPNLVIGHDFGVRSVDAADVAGVDLIPVGPTPDNLAAEAALGDQRVFKFPAGQYRIHFFAAHRISLDSTFGAWVFCVDPSTDVVKRYSVSGRANAQASTPFGTIAGVNQIGQEIEFTKLLNLVNETYITIISGTFEGDTIANIVDGIHSMRIERLS